MKTLSMFCVCSSSMRTVESLRMCVSTRYKIMLRVSHQHIFIQQHIRIATENIKMRMFLILMLCIFMSETTFSQQQPDNIRDECTVTLPDITEQQVDCRSTSNTSCMLQATNKTLQPIPPTIENHSQCYDTCVTSQDDMESSQCIASTVPIPFQQSLMEVSGPFYLKEYTFYSISSPRNNDSFHYPNNKHCKYHLACEEYDSYLSLQLQDIEIEEPSDECSDNTMCLDFIRFEFPTGSQCTVCGSDFTCREDGRRLNQLLLFNSHQHRQHHGLTITFQSNRKGRSCGFHLLASCVKKDYFESSDCSVPPQLIPPTEPLPFPIGFGKRAAGTHDESRERLRFSRRTSITVYSYASVTYDNNVVRVLVNDRYLHSFPGVHVLQVYNSIEGSITYYGTANGRKFPGYGFLKIGIGIVYYTQESVPSQFKPNKSERRLIQLLHRGLLAHQQNDDNECYTPLTVKQREEMEQMAVEYGQACNGFLRAAACAYQQLYMARESTDCLVNVTFPTATAVPFLNKATSSGNGGINDE